MKGLDETLPAVDLLLGHRDAARILAGTVPSGPNRLRLAETMLGTLLGAGFSRRDAVRAGFLLTDYATHFVAEESRFADAGEPHDSSESRDLTQVRQQFETLPKGSTRSQLRSPGT